jgi:hypothetical protein
MASAIAKDVGVSEADVVEGVIELLERGRLKILMRDGTAGLVPCVLGGRLLDEVRRAEQAVAPRFDPPR